MLSVLKFDHVSYKTAQKYILDKINLEIDAGDFISVVGPSGCGKSTFLKLCCNLLSPTNGTVFYQEKNMEDYSPIIIRREISYCFQAPFLFGETVLDNLIYPFYLRNEKYNEEIVSGILEQFSLNDSLLNQNPSKLSGGEKQRIALIRSLIYKPKILLLDEITSSLDETNTRLVESVIRKLNEEGITILWITHNREQSRKYANKVLTIGDGIIHSLERICK